MYVFTLKETVLGICDEEHLIEKVKKIWAESCEAHTENDVVKLRKTKLHLPSKQQNLISSTVKVFPEKATFWIWRQMWIS